MTGGSYRGRRLRAAPSARPATGMVREAIFNRPLVQAVMRRRVLDLYAGSGFLGVEALSRGAAWVDFVEQDRAACDVIAANIASVEAADRSAIHLIPVERALQRLHGPYDLCFADPPYPDNATAVLEAVATSGVLVAEGLLVWRYPWRRAGPERLGTLARVDVRRYGDGALAIYQGGGESW